MGTMPAMVVSAIAEYLSDRRSFVAFTSACTHVRGAIRPHQYANHIRRLMDDYAGDFDPTPITYRALHEPTPPGCKFRELGTEGFAAGAPLAGPAGASNFFYAIFEDIKRMDEGVWKGQSMDAESSFMQALRWNLLPLAKWMHANGAEATDFDPLLHATWSRNIEVLRFAVDESLSASYLHCDAEDPRIWTAIDEAFDMDDTDMVQYLVQMVHDDSVPRSLVHNIGEKTWSEAIKNEDLDFVAGALDAGNDGSFLVKLAGAQLASAMTKFLHARGVDVQPAFVEASAQSPDQEVIAYLDSFARWNTTTDPAFPDQECLDTALIEAFRFMRPVISDHLLKCGAKLRPDLLDDFVARRFHPEIRTRDVTEKFLFDFLRAHREASWDWESLVTKWSTKQPYPDEPRFAAMDWKKGKDRTERATVQLRINNIQAGKQLEAIIDESPYFERASIKFTVPPPPSSGITLFKVRVFKFAPLVKPKPVETDVPGFRLRPKHFLGHILKPDQPKVNVLILGQKGAGKSSFLNSSFFLLGEEYQTLAMNSAKSDHVTLGIDEFDSGKDQSFFPFRFFDSRGISETNYSGDELSLLANGLMPLGVDWALMDPVGNGSGVTTAMVAQYVAVNGHHLIERNGRHVVTAISRMDTASDCRERDGYLESGKRCLSIETAYPLINYTSAARSRRRFEVDTMMADVWIALAKAATDFRTRMALGQAHGARTRAEREYLRRADSSPTTPPALDSPGRQTLSNELYGMRVSSRQSNDSPQQRDRAWTSHSVPHLPLVNSPPASRRIELQASLGRQTLSLHHETQAPDLRSENARPQEQSRYSIMQLPSYNSVVRQRDGAGPNLPEPIPDSSNPDEGLTPASVVEEVEDTADALATPAVHPIPPPPVMVSDEEFWDRALKIGNLAKELRVQRHVDFGLVHQQTRRGLLYQKAFLSTYSTHSSDRHDFVNGLASATEHL
ncbi:hypothetical protein HDU89_008933 [Geranomyces variabilis]|nr:hypothetical protein HDU89_008933 [Geranomyces variabilis]